MNKTFLVSPVFVIFCMLPHSSVKPMSPSALSKNAIAQAITSDTKETQAINDPETILAKIGDRIFITAQPPQKSIDYNDHLMPSLEMLKDPYVVSWYTNKSKNNATLNNLVALVEYYFITSVFPTISPEKIYVEFDIDETSLVVYPALINIAKKIYGPSHQNFQGRHLGDFTANAPIRNLYNFFKDSACHCVFVSCRKSFAKEITYQSLNKNGYRCNKEDIFLCPDFDKAKKRQELIQAGSFSYIVVIDDQLSFLLDDPNIHCNIWVPSALRMFHSGLQTFYNMLKHWKLDLVQKPQKSHHAFECDCIML